MSLGITKIFDVGDLIPNPIQILWGIIIGQLVLHVLIPKIKQVWRPRTTLYLVTYAVLLPAMLLPVMGSYVLLKVAFLEMNNLMLRHMSFELLFGFALWIICGSGLLYACARWIRINHERDKNFVPLIELAYD